MFTGCPFGNAVLPGVPGYKLNPKDQSTSNGKEAPTVRKKCQLSLVVRP